jgi:hypothetical protein
MTLLQHMVYLDINYDDLQQLDDSNTQEINS